MQDAAIAQSAARGVSSAAFTELGYAWMLNRIHLEVDRYPRILERIVIETWGSNLTGLYAIREFRVLDEADCEIARATSRWIVIDVARKRAIRLPGLLVERYGVVPERALADSFPKLELSDGREHQAAFRVRWSELDGNRHANSACYVDWLVESVPKEVLEGHVLRELELEYKRELVLGDALVSESGGGTGEAGHGVVFEHSIVRDEGEVVVARGVKAPSSLPKLEDIRTYEVTFEEVAGHLEESMRFMQENFLRWVCAAGFRSGFPRDFWDWYWH